jgi:hypothetical protein
LARNLRVLLDGREASSHEVEAPFPRRRDYDALGDGDDAYPPPGDGASSSGGRGGGGGSGGGNKSGIGAVYHYPYAAAVVAGEEEEEGGPTPLVETTLAFFEVGSGCVAPSCAATESLVEVRVFAGSPDGPTTTSGGAGAGANATGSLVRYSWWVEEDGPSGRERVWGCGDAEAGGGADGECGGRPFGVRVRRACLSRSANNGSSASPASPPGCLRLVFGAAATVPLEGFGAFESGPGAGKYYVFEEGKGRYNPRFAVAVNGTAAATVDGATYHAVEFGLGGGGTGGVRDCPREGASCRAPEREAGADASSSVLEVFHYRSPAAPLSLALYDAHTGAALWEEGDDRGASSRNGSATSPPGADDAYRLMYDRVCLPRSGCHVLVVDRRPAAVANETAAPGGSGSDESGGGGGGGGAEAHLRVSLDGEYVLNTRLGAKDARETDLPLLVALGEGCTRMSLCDAYLEESLLDVRFGTGGSAAYVPHEFGRWTVFDAHDLASIDAESVARFAHGYPPGSAFRYLACLPRRGVESLVLGVHASHAAGFSWDARKDGTPLPCRSEPTFDGKRAWQWFGYVSTPLDGSCPGGVPLEAGLAAGIGLAAVAAVLVAARVYCCYRRWRRASPAHRQASDAASSASRGAAQAPEAAAGSAAASRRRPAGSAPATRSASTRVRDGPAAASGARRRRAGSARASRSAATRVRDGPAAAAGARRRPAGGARRSDDDDYGGGHTVASSDDSWDEDEGEDEDGGGAGEGAGGGHASGAGAVCIDV